MSSYLRTLCSACLLAFALFATSSVRASVVTSIFYAGGVAREIEIEKDYVAIRSTGAPTTKLSLLTSTEAAAFQSMDLEILPRSSVNAQASVVGLPLWFERGRGAVGVLTDEIVIRVSSASGLRAIRGQTGFRSLREARFGHDVHLARFGSPLAALAAANALRGLEGIVYAHPNFLIPKDFRRATTGPETEPLFAQQWHLENRGQRLGLPGADIHVKDAWDVTTGDPRIVVAVLDGGFDTAHRDLDGAWVHNPGEIPGNGVDDDSNGYIDDVTGWNFSATSNDPSTGPVVNHGTAVAGLVGARRNGTGMTGVCPECAVLPVVVAWTPEADAAAFHYAAQRGASVITNSWGYAIGTPTTDVVADAIAEVATQGRGGRGALILFAMNNYDIDDCVGSQPDISSLDAVIAVSGSSDLDRKVSFSAWGDCMELLSPTYESRRPGIATTDQTGAAGYNTGANSNEVADPDYTNSFSGTSAATPIAAGVFGLMLSINDDLTRDEALALALSSADKIQPELAQYDPASGFSLKYGYGRINAGRAVRAAQVFKKYTRRDAPARPGTSVRR